MVQESDNYTDIKSNLVQAYSRDAQRRDAAELQEWKHSLRSQFLQRLRSQASHTLLEIGAGTGKDSLFFREHGLKVVATDLTFAMTRLCRQKGLDTCSVDLSNIPFSAQHFDAVWSMNCLLHIPQGEIPKVLLGIQTVLQPGGLFHWGVYGGKNQASVYEQDDLRPQRFFSFLTDESLLELAERFFTIDAFTKIPLPNDESGLHFQSLVLRRT